MKQCNFCTRTEDNVEALYKGILNCYICDKCIKMCMLRTGKQIIDEMFSKGDKEKDLENKVNELETKLKAIPERYKYGRE